MSRTEGEDVLKEVGAEGLDALRKRGFRGLTRHEHELGEDQEHL